MCLLRSVGIELLFDTIETATGRGGGGETLRRIPLGVMGVMRGCVGKETR